MDILTINIIIENQEGYADNKKKFIENNQEALKRIKGIEGLKVQVGNPGGAYDQYCDLLKKTDSKYVVFYTDDNTICLNQIEESLNILKKKEDNILCQKVQRDNPTITAEQYLTGGKGLNPLYLGRYIFKPKVLRDIDIRPQEIPFFKDKIILVSTRDLVSIEIIETMVVYTEEALEQEIEIFQAQFHKSWYIDYFQLFLLPYAQERKNLTVTEQRLIVHMIVERFYLNQNSRNKFVLDESETDNFFDLTRKLLKYIDDQYLIEIRKKFEIVNFLPYLFLKEKYQKKPEFTISQKSEKTKYFYNNIKFGTNCVAARIKLIDEDGGNLLLNGEIVGDYCFEEISKDFIVLVNEEKIAWKKSEIYNLTSFFGRATHRYTFFEVEMPKEKMNTTIKMQFKGIIQGMEITLPIQFHKKVTSRLTRSHWAYWCFDNKMVTFAPEYIQISPVNKWNCILREIVMLYKTLDEKDEKYENVKAVRLRLLYWLTRGKYKSKPIWLYFDKLYKAGDNGEYLFRYNIENHPEVDNYYIVSKESLDYERLKKEFGKHILVYGSVRQRLLALNAEIIFATHASVWAFCGFAKNTQKYYKNMLNAKIVCIQHGLTIQNIAQYQNRLADNTKQYFCASKYEIANLEKPIYGYDKSNLHLTGCPRYDGLKNNDQKQILISPTWRRNIVITGNTVGTAKEYNPEFKHTEYFKIYNKLINDQRLISIAKNYGYKIIFLIHPTLSSQVGDYDKNKYTSIIPAVSEVSYEEMLTKSSVMVTDYSGIQFDFAYMKKPILYYHPKELPPQYEEGVYKYDSMGFGPIIEEYDELIVQLCRCVENQCKMEDKYLQRVEDFFEYTDDANCERIMEVIQNWKK